MGKAAAAQQALTDAQAGLFENPVARGAGYGGQCLHQRDTGSKQGRQRTRPARGGGLVCQRAKQGKVQQEAIHGVLHCGMTAQPAA